MLDAKVKERIESAIKNNKIMLYMKGEKDQPMCGFSAQVVNILGKYGANFESQNILEDWDLREGIKEFSSWPTIPQLYVDGKFIGGCDIVMELDRKGDLETILKG